MQQGPWARKAARRRTGLHTILALIFLAAAAGLGYLAIVQVPKWLQGPDLAASPEPSPSSTRLDPLPGCRGPAFPDYQQLGTVAWVDGSTLYSADLSTCRQKTLVATGADGPVAFSPDGKWIAYGAGSYVKAAGGKEAAVPDATSQWAWAPRGDRLVFVTKDGGLSLVEPGGKPNPILAPSAGRAEHPAWSPDGTKIAVSLPDRILVVDVDTLEPRAVFTTTETSPEVAGWTPDSKWVLFWAKQLGDDAGKFAGRALDAVPAAGGDWLNVWDSMLPFGDFVTRCGREVAIAGGGRKLVSEGKQILLTGPPGWDFHNITNDYLRSWVWPACSPDSRLLAVTSMANHEEESFAASVRVLWVIRVANGKRERIDPPESGAFEAPRWGRDGRTIMVVQRSEPDWDAPGSIVLVEVDPDTGKMVQTVDLEIDVGRAPGEGGHQRWNETLDWYQPRPAPSASPSPSPGTDAG